MYANDRFFFRFAEQILKLINNNKKPKLKWQKN